MPQNSPIQFLLKHKNVIMETYRQNDKNYGKTWDNLQKTLPEVAKAMRINTFKQYMSVFVILITELEKVIQERDQVIQKLFKTACLQSELENRVEELEETLDKVRQERDQVTQKLFKTERLQSELENQVKELEGTLDKVRQERDRVTQKLFKTERLQSELENQVEELEGTLDKVRQKESTENKIIQKLDTPPKRVEGWSIQLAKDGYYRCYRKIRNRVHSVYIGKTFDFDKVRSKITIKEKQIGLYNS